jgi:DNA-binding transcriptional MerR regulator
MEKALITRDALLTQASIPPEALADWLKWKLIEPEGYADDKSPLFSQDAFDRAAHILKLAELGYGPEAVQKILKKVGLPQKAGSHKKAHPKSRFLTVGDLAERSGVSPRTIKHWEEKGIIDPDMRTEGGFRLYSEGYVFLCKLIRDLQLFGYTLEEIKVISDHFRDFLAIEGDPEALPKAVVEAKLDTMLKEIQALFDKMKLLGEGIDRWQDLLKKKRKDILSLRAKNAKRADEPEEEKEEKGA